MTKVILLQRVPNENTTPARLRMEVELPIVPRAGDTVVTNDAVLRVKRVELSVVGASLPAVYVRSNKEHHTNSRRRYEKFLDAKRNAGWTVEYIKPAAKKVKK